AQCCYPLEGVENHKGTKDTKNFSSDLCDLCVFVVYFLGWIFEELLQLVPASHDEVVDGKDTDHQNLRYLFGKITEQEAKDQNRTGLGLLAALAGIVGYL